MNSSSDANSRRLVLGLSPQDKCLVEEERRMRSAAEAVWKAPETPSWYWAIVFMTDAILSCIVYQMTGETLLLYLAGFLALRTIYEIWLTVSWHKHDAEDTEGPENDK